MSGGNRVVLWLLGRLVVEEERLDREACVRAGVDLLLFTRGALQFVDFERRPVRCLGWR
ncbi:MAG: hypothetical protein M3P51_14745 [Chloroflexota bacterium]|nr:hypothetical protein [Chloroflexota bacterium]